MSINATYKSGAISVKIEGAEEIKSRLNQLEDQIKRRLLIDVMKKSLMRAMEEAQSRTPIGPSVVRTNKKSGGKYSNIPGILRKSFRLKKMRSDNPYLLEVQLQNTAYYALWVEMGHRIVKGKRGARRVVGSAKAKPFMRPTFESQKQSIIDQVARELKTGLERRGV